VKIFIDSADLDEISKAFAWGIADGVTTNPSLMKQAIDKRKGQNLNLDAYIKKILKLAKGAPVSLEVTETSKEGMIQQGLALFKRYNHVAHNVYIKIPINPAFKEGDPTHFDGIAAIKYLTKKKIPTNCTLIFTPEQALLAAKAGASFASPFAGRVDDFIRMNNKKKFDKTAYYPMDGMKNKSRILEDNGIVSGIDLVAQCVEILEHYGLKTKVLAASLRNPQQVREAALVGAHISTIPFLVIGNLLKHPKTYEGMKKFTADIVPEYVELTK
jgi:transaldolase